MFTDLFSMKEIRNANKKNFKTQIIRIKLKSYNVALLDSSIVKLVSIFRENGYEISGPIPLPIKSKRVTVVRSPHIDGSSKERFVCDTHTRLFDCIVSGSAVDGDINQIFENLNLPAGIGVEISVSGYNQANQEA
jgi:small subunit ribosomal protein S10